MSKKLKVMTVLGTRPEIIRLSRVMPLLDKHTRHKIVHTGQNYDFQLSEVFFDDLGIRSPDYFMQADRRSLGRFYGSVLQETEAAIKRFKPDALLVLGDTNSAIAAIMARRMKVPVYHMEAGNRCFDQNVPEEINRKIIDHVADFNLVYTEHARRHLISEGLDHRRIYLTGSPMGEVLMHNMEKINASGVLKRLKLKEGKYFVVSVHREENVDNPGNLKKLLAALDAVRREFRLPLVVSTHPRTRKRMKALGGKKLSSRIRFLKPFGFIDYVNLQQNAQCVISDSGTISEEAAILRFPAVTVRNATERPESLDTGNIILAGCEPERVVDAVRVMTSEREAIQTASIPPEYRVTDVSQRVLKLIVGTAGLSNRWAGIETDK